MAMRAANTCLLLVVAMAPATLSAANLGAVTAYEKTAHGIAGRTATVKFAVDVYSPQIIRVRVTPQDSPQNVGYALTTDQPPAFSQFSVDAADPVVVVKTSNITAEVELRPDLRITFKDANGVVINEDLPGKELGMTQNGNKFTVYKRLQGRRALHRHGRGTRESRPARNGAHAQEHGQLSLRRSQGAHVREHPLLHGAASREGLRLVLQ
jgi:hypothetical protein